MYISENLLCYKENGQVDSEKTTLIFKKFINGISLLLLPADCARFNDWWNDPNLTLNDECFCGFFSLSSSIP